LKYAEHPVKYRKCWQTVLIWEKFISAVYALHFLRSPVKCCSVWGWNDVGWIKSLLQFVYGPVPAFHNSEGIPHWGLKQIYSAPGFTV
jgi:hypothetical protein